MAHPAFLPMGTRRPRRVGLTAARAPRLQTLHVCLGARKLICAALTLLATATLAADPAVTARLSIPPAEINVIGDPVTLTWHFTNPTPKPMAFVWEACCRLNGRLTVSEGGVDLPPIPPGPAAAHAFAKPAIILPGKENAFESMLVDWVFIKRTGRYEIRGHYVGVLPEQKPPYPRTVELWRGQVDTAPVAVELVSIDDYLAQRPRRSAQRGLAATVTGPDRFPPLGEIPLQLHVRNTGATSLSLQWPLDANLWFVDTAGLRVNRSSSRPAGPDQTVSLPPGGEWAVAFPVSAADLQGAPFGRYRVFVDFPANHGQPRTPSAPHELRWELGAAETAALLNDAVMGTSAAGPRNLPLRVLRQHLAALEPVLSGLDEARLAPAALPLRRQLQLAACLRDLPTLAGRATLRLAVPPGGAWRFAEPALLRCATGTPMEQLQAVTGARRHLGLELAPRLLPAEAATVADLLAASASLAGLAAEFAASPRWIPEAPANAIPGGVSFPSAPPPANLVLRLIRRGDGVVASIARHLAATPESPSLVRAGDFPTLRFQPLTTAAALESLIAEGKPPAPQTVILADPSLRWSTLAPWLAPMLTRGWQVDLIAAE